MKLQKLNNVYRKVICEAVNAPALKEVINAMNEYLQKGKEESNNKKLSVILNEFLVRFNAYVKEIPEKNIIQRSLMLEIKKVLGDLSFTDLKEVKSEILAKVDEYFKDSDAEELPQAKKTRDICADAADEALAYLEKSSIYTSYVEEEAERNKKKIENVFSKIDAANLSENDIEVFLKEDGSFKKFNRKVRAMTKMAIGFWNNHPYCFMTFTDAGLIDRINLVSQQKYDTGAFLKMSEVERNCDKIIAIYNGAHIADARKKVYDRYEQKRFEETQSDYHVKADNNDRYRRALNEKRRNSEFDTFNKEYSNKIQELKDKLISLKATMDEIDIFADDSADKIIAFNKAVKIYRDIVSDLSYYKRNPTYTWYKDNIIKAIDSCQSKIDEI